MLPGAGACHLAASLALRDNIQPRGRGDRVGGDTPAVGGPTALHRTLSSGVPPIGLTPAPLPHLEGILSL